MESGALWRLIIETKYDNLRGGWCSKVVLVPFGEEVVGNFFKICYILGG
jgi:hypothetical protein